MERKNKMNMQFTLRDGKDHFEGTAVSPLPMDVNREITKLQFGKLPIQDQLDKLQLQVIKDVTNPQQAAHNAKLLEEGTRLQTQLDDINSKIDALKDAKKLGNEATALLTLNTGGYAVIPQGSTLTDAADKEVDVKALLAELNKGSGGRDSGHGR
jgi:hypothetical protein